MRDFQRKRVYRSEWACRFDHRKIGSLEECQAYVDELLFDPALNYFRSVNPITVVQGRGWTSAQATFNWEQGNVMVLPDWAQNEFTIIHELAHFAIPFRCADHGPEFVWTELQLLQRTFGKRDADEFRGWLSHYRVKVGKTKSARKQRAPKHWTPPGQTGTL